MRVSKTLSLGTDTLSFYENEAIRAGISLSEIIELNLQAQKKRLEKRSTNKYINKQKKER